MEMRIKEGKAQSSHLAVVKQFWRMMAYRKKHIWKVPMRNRNRLLQLWKDSSRNNSHIKILLSKYQKHLLKIAIHKKDSLTILMTKWQRRITESQEQLRKMMKMIFLAKVI